MLHEKFMQFLKNSAKNAESINLTNEHFYMCIFKRKRYLSIEVWIFCLNSINENPNLFIYLFFWHFDILPVILSLL